MKMMLFEVILCVLLSTTLTLGAEKQIQLEDIEQDNLSAKQAQQRPQLQQQPQQLHHQQQQHQQQQQQQQQQQHQQQQQLQAKPLQTPSAPEYAGQVEVQQPGHQQLEYNTHQQQILLQHLQAYQPQVQFQAPPTASALALYPAAFLAGNGLAGNNLGIGGITQDVALPAAYITPQHQGVPTGSSSAFPQQIYLQGGYAGLQFVPASASPLIYGNQQAPPEPPKVAQSPVTKQDTSAPNDANVQSQQPPSHGPRVPQPTFQQPRVQAPLPSSAAASADPNFVYTSQQAYNPIPKELQSYTTIPDSVYQGKEPDFVYDQQPSVSLTNDQFNPYNALYQQTQSQRPVLSPGVKSPVAPSLKSFSSGGAFFTRNNFLNPTRHFPGPGISYSSYRQGPGAF